MEQQIKVCAVKNYAPITSLKFHPKNRELRMITRERMDDLKDSITTKGFYEPILIWKKTGVVLAGEHRTRAALELIEEGYTFISDSGKKNHLPVVVEDCDEDTAFQILHESNNHYATWIDEKLAEAMREAEAAGQNMRAFGYSQDELDKMLEEVEKESKKLSKELEEGTDDEPKPEPKAPEYQSLMLPVEVYGKMMEVLGIVALSINPTWKEGDSIVQAAEALCDVIVQAGVLERLTGKEPAKKKTNGTRKKVASKAKH